jgi:NADPH:quinone reductase-like Zn-dependent oxidoreductase
MKAILLSQYGSPDKLTLSDVPTPQPKPGEVLVKIHATSINDVDWSMVRGKPHIYRLLFGVGKPKFKIAGAEVAGDVEAIGAGVTGLKVGDRVYGDLSESGFGGFAEYVSVPESSLTIMPAGMSYEQAAATPHAAMLALQGLVDLGKIRQGERVLINGAGGGVGMFAAQIAKEYGCEVTGVDRDFKLDALTHLGYDKVIDYQKVDFTENHHAYDLILDAKTTRSPRRYLNALKPGGRYVTVGGDLPRLLQILFYGLALKLVRSNTRTLQVLALKPNKGLNQIGQLFESKGLKCLIDGPYSLDQVPMAMTHFGKGGHVGKVVIKVI